MNGARILAVCGLAVGVAVSTLTDTTPSRETITVDGYQVLSGDFHVHAFVGDGGIAPWMMQDHAAHLGLDVIAITNHNQTLAGRLGRSAAEQSHSWAQAPAGGLCSCGFLSKVGPNSVPPVRYCSAFSKRNACCSRREVGQRRRE